MEITPKTLLLHPKHYSEVLLNLLNCVTILPKLWFDFMWLIQVYFWETLVICVKNVFCSFSDDTRNQKPFYLIDCYLYKCHVLNIKPTTYTNVDHFNELDNKKQNTISIHPLSHQCIFIFKIMFYSCGTGVNVTIRLFQQEFKYCSQHTVRLF